MGGKQLCSTAEEPEMQKGEGLHMQLELVTGGQDSWTLKPNAALGQAPPAHICEVSTHGLRNMAYPLSSSNHSPQFIRGF